MMLLVQYVVHLFILGEFGFLLTTIALVFLIFSFIPNCFLTSFILLANSESSFSFPANNAIIVFSLTLRNKTRALPKIVVFFASHVDTLHIDNV